MRSVHSRMFGSVFSSLVFLFLLSATNATLTLKSEELFLPFGGDCYVYLLIKDLTIFNGKSRLVLNDASGEEVNLVLMLRVNDSEVAEKALPNGDGSLKVKCDGKTFIFDVVLEGERIIVCPEGKGFVVFVPTDFIENTNSQTST